MPPTSRGLLLFRIIHQTPLLIRPFLRPRHASSKLKIPGHLRPPPKPTAPSSVAESVAPPSKPPHWSQLFFARLRRLRRSVAIQTILRILPLLPIIAVAIHHFPLEHRTVEGPSMQPTFNPNHTSEAGKLNTKMHVIVLKQNFSETSLSNAFSRFFQNDQYRKRDSTLHRGEIVVYRAPHNPERISVKRVVGIPGDRVTPLPGYTGGEDAVIVPFNHLWLEGDVEDPSKSVDSNSFGPISANLVIGTVKLILPSFTRIDWEHAIYPAQRRVDKDVVHQQNPDDVIRRQAYLDGRAARDLEVVKAYPLARPLTKMERQQWEVMLQNAVAEKATKDTRTYGLAGELETEIRNKLTTKVVRETLLNVEMSQEELAAFRRDGVVPESVLARSQRSAG